jgi:hypothetical protein
MMESDGGKESATKELSGRQSLANMDIGIRERIASSTRRMNVLWYAVTSATKVFRLRMRTFLRSSKDSVIV